MHLRSYASHGSPSSVVTHAWHVSGRFASPAATRTSLEAKTVTDQRQMANNLQRRGWWMAWGLNHHLAGVQLVGNGWELSINISNNYWPKKAFPQIHNQETLRVTLLTIHFWGITESGKFSNSPLPSTCNWKNTSECKRCDYRLS